MTPALAALSDGDPCGPDLEAEADGAYLTCVTRVRGELPFSYFDYLFPEREEDRVRIDTALDLADLDKLGARTHDLRLWSLRARLQILARDLAGFGESVEAVADLLERFWGEVHPRPEGASVDLRRLELDALDAPTVVFPLQYTPVCVSRRIGKVSWRLWLFAQKSAKPRPGEDAHSVTAVLDALRDADPDDLAASRAGLARLVTALTRIRAVWQERAGEGPPLGKLTDLATAIRGWLEGAPGEAARPAAAAPAPDGKAGPREAPAPEAAPDIATEPVAGAALAAVAAYYRGREPSSPALPLVEQALHLRGKSFFEALEVLLPDHARQASFRIGTQWVFDLSVQQVAGLDRGEAAPPEAGAKPGGWFGPAASKPPAVASREAALGAMAAVAAFYRANEPSSPVPLLLDRAAALAERDFLSLLRDVLPKSALRDANEE